MLKNKKTVIRCLWMCCVAGCSFSTSASETGYSHPDDTANINAKMVLIKQMKDADSAKARIQLTDVFLRSRKLVYLSGIAQSASQLGAYYHRQFNLTSSREYFSTSFQAFRQMGNRTMEANMANNLGAIAEKTGNYADAVSKYLYAFELFDSLNNITGISATANNIGIVYYLTDKPQKALNFFRVALSLKKQLRDTASMIYTYQNLGNVFFDLWEYDSASFYYQKCIDLSAKSNDDLSAGKAYNSMGVIAMIGKNKTHALQMFNRSLYYSRIQQDMQNISSVHDNIGLLYLNEGKSQTAIACFDSSLAISKSYGLKEEMKNAFLHLSNAYSLRQDYKEAFSNLQSYENLQGELMTEKGNVAGIEAVFIKQKQENKILSLEKDQEKRKAQILMLSGALIIVLITSFLGFYIYRIKQKAAMERRLSELEKARFKAVIEAQEMERKRIAGDLHDSVGQMLSLSKLHLSEIMDNSSAYTGEQVQLYSRSMQLIDEACQEIRNISHNLMPGPLIRLGLLAAIKDLIRKINISKKIQITLESNLEATRFEEKVEISIYRVIQEIFNNILKHACASEVAVTLMKSAEKNFKLSIADNGIGFDTREIVTSSGIGWKSIYSRLTMINGSMEINSSKNAGTRIEIRFFL